MKEAPGPSILHGIAPSGIRFRRVYLKPNFVRRELIPLSKVFHCKCQALGAGIAVTQRIVHRDLRS